MSNKRFRVKEIVYSFDITFSNHNHLPDTGKCGTVTVTRPFKMDNINNYDTKTCKTAIWKFIKKYNINTEILSLQQFLATDIDLAAHGFKIVKMGQSFIRTVNLYV